MVGSRGLGVSLVLGGLLLLTTTALAGGRTPPPRAVHPGGAAVKPATPVAMPEFRPQGAFGSPGGYPFRSVRDDHVRRAREAPGRARHVVPHRSVLGVPSTALFWGWPTLEEPRDVAPPVTVAPTIYVAPVVYVAPPLAAPTPLATAAAAPALPRVVEHATGRYELRGDGMAAPYEWVWIPYPPPAPPPEAEAPRVSAVAPTPRSRIYRWTDVEGTSFWTNRVEDVPEAHRARADRPAAGVTP